MPFSPAEIPRRLNYWRFDLRGRRWLRAAEARAPLWLDPADFAGRTLAIIGPAAPVGDELAQRPPPPDALIVRLNAGLRLAAEAPEIHGARTDILVHNLNTDGPRGTGPIDPAALAAQGVRHLLYPHSEPRKVKRRVLERHAVMAGQTPDLRLPPVAIYRDLETLIGGAPTAGAVAIALFAAAPLARLSIYGFTFFSTAYAPGYNDRVSTTAEARAWAAASDLHDPAAEARAIARLLSRPGTPPLYLGAGVKAALEGY